jgi:hypothetical protein
VIDPSLIDVFPKHHDGYTAAMEAEDTNDAVRGACGDTVIGFPDQWWIEPKEWEERAKYNDAHGLWPSNYLPRYLNQSPSHECTCHSLVMNCEIARNRARGVTYKDGPVKGFRYEQAGKTGAVYLSPLSVYAEANPGEWGGANVRRVMEIAVRRGILPDDIQPADYGFKHTLQGTSGKGNLNQSGGDWIPVRKFPAGWESTASLFKPTGVIIADMWEQVVCLLIHGVAYSVGRNGHAVCWNKWDWKQRLFPYADSYDVTRYDSERTAKGAYRGGFGIVQVKQPDNLARAAA